ncbi:mucin-associated surface protein (MASP) [Trypanosoma cruzi Dm28c]|uniref:Mucin-associated surface protein (MASP) n=2 Tax=Trypanosoma cruzi TaxID=5693 RepID=V5AI98_TRYCR|nr:mucin-associated surface protein (MASP) [Trypanosoma cruzi Dm28c]PWU99835.1 Mucin-associated surface protein (MASP) [Trypanosoma cruzi]
MAVRMTGRVLLVCALCVLWCGAGGVYAKDLDNIKALGGCMASGVLGAKTSYVPNGCNKYMPTPPLRSALPIPAIQAEVVNLGDDSQNGDNLSKGTPPGSPGSGGGGGGKGSPAAAGPPGAATSPVPPPGPPAAPVAGPTGVPGSAGPGGVAGGEVDSVVPSGVHASPHIDVTVTKSSDLSTKHSGSREEVLQQKATETHDSSPSNERTQEALSNVQQPQISTSENIKTGCGPEASNCENEQSVGKTTMEKRDSEASKIKESPPATQNTKSKDNEENPTEASSQESQNTEPQQEIKTPVDESDTTSTDASTAVAARSTAGSQEEATESSSNGSHSPLQGEVFTGTDAPENAPSPGAAETEKRQGENVTKDGDSDSSTADFHATSPLLRVRLLLR